MTVLQEVNEIRMWRTHMDSLWPYNVVHAAYRQFALFDTLHRAHSIFNASECLQVRIAIRQLQEWLDTHRANDPSPLRDTRFDLSAITEMLNQFLSRIEKLTAPNDLD